MIMRSFHQSSIVPLPPEPAVPDLFGFSTTRQSPVVLVLGRVWSGLPVCAIAGSAGSLRAASLIDRLYGVDRIALQRGGATNSKSLPTRLDYRDRVVIMPDLRLARALNVL
jgi:hypothetical protein